MSSSSSTENLQNFANFIQDMKNFTSKLYSEGSEVESSITNVKENQEHTTATVSLKRKSFSDFPSSFEDATTTAVPHSSSVSILSDSSSDSDSSNSMSYDSIPTFQTIREETIGQPTQTEHSSSQSSNSQQENSASISSSSPSTKKSRKKLKIIDSVKTSALLDEKTIAKDLGDLIPCCTLNCYQHYSIADILQIRKITALQPDHNIKDWLIAKLESICVHDNEGGYLFHFIVNQRNVCGKFYRFAYGIKEGRWNACMEVALNPTSRLNPKPFKKKNADMAEYIQQWFERYLLSYAEHVPTRKKLRRYLPTYLRWEDICLDIQEDFKR